MHVGWQRVFILGQTRQTRQLNEGMKIKMGGCNETDRDLKLWDRVAKPGLKPHATTIYIRPRSEMKQTWKHGFEDACYSSKPDIVNKGESF